jgi:hypothetical protein
MLWPWPEPQAYHLWNRDIGEGRALVWPEEMDELDKAILNRIQTRFPLAPRPFESIAQELGTTEERC